MALSGMTGILYLNLGGNLLTGAFRLCVVYLSAFCVVICRLERVRLYLAGAPCGDDGVFISVCLAGNLAALSGMTSMQTLDLSNNHLTGAFRLCLVHLSAFCVVICRPGRVRVYLAGVHVALMAFCLFACVCRAGNLTALSGMTGMQNFDLSSNQLTGAFGCVLCISLHFVL